jgi:single-strand DNA-binding protein
MAGRGNVRENLKEAPEWLFEDEPNKLLAKTKNQNLAAFAAVSDRSVKPMNIVVEMGRLVAAPELKQTQSGKAVCSFRIAVNRGGKDKGADFFDVVAWEKTAEFVSKYFQKGSMIAITGKLQSRQYQDKNGNNRTVIEIVANNVDFCGGKPEQRIDEGGNIPHYAQEVSEKAYKDEFAAISDSDDLPF